MSEENSSEKKHQPSAKKLERLRKEGSFMRARELYTAMSLILALVTLYLCANQWYNAWTNTFRISFKAIGPSVRNGSNFSELAKDLLGINSLVVLPVFGVMFLGFILTVALFGRIQFPEKLIQFKWERLDALKNLKRTYSSHTLIELGKSLLKLILFLSVLISFYELHHADILNLQKIQNLQSIEMTFSLLSNYMPYLILVLLCIAVLDGTINYLQYQKKAMMTTQEMKDESKETDGNPEIKKRVRQTQLAIAMQRLQKEMPTASVVLTNPTHYAVALRYINNEDAAPIILAKGVDHKAQQIRQLAAKHGVPIYQAPELARAIYKTGKIGGQIHPELYMAVALVLSYIMQLKEYQLGRAKFPNPVVDLNVPEHLS